MCISNNIKEQVKISKFLSLLDKHIELWERKLQLYLLKKNYYLNSMFSNDGSLHFLRFKEFNKPWIKEVLGKFLVENNFINDDYGKRLTVKLNLQGVFKRELKSIEKVGETRQYTRNYNDFIYGKQNIHKGCFGIIPKELDGYVSSSDIPSFSCNERLHPYFLFYNFSRSKFYKSLENKMTGTGSKRLQVQTFFNLSILIPNSIDEQIKISKFLSLLDNNIKLSQENIDNLKIKKLFYIDKMFI